MKLSFLFFLTILTIGCISSKNTLNPIENNELNAQSEKWLKTNIPDEYREQISFVGAYSGIQCSVNWNDIDSLNSYPDKYKQYYCFCYNYELKTAQNQKLYIGTNSTLYSLFRICFDSENKVVELPNRMHILAATKQKNNKYLSLEDVKLISEKEVKGKTKFGTIPKLTYRYSEDKVFWEVTRYKGWLNVSVYKFKIDAVNAEIIQITEVPYRRTFWQWLTGLKY